MVAIVGGADEAGRGPVLGPLVICAACFRDEHLPGLLEQGVDDSKQLSPKRRRELFDVITKVSEGYELQVLDAQEINQSMAAGTNLNEIEVNAFVRAINALILRGLLPKTIWIDAADVNPERFGERIRKQLKGRVEVIAQHKADATFTAVGAASILAKHTRDKLIQDIASDYRGYGEIGSGYPSDPKTRAFLKKYFSEHGKFPPIARTAWETLEKLKRDLGVLPKGQTKLF